MPLPSLDLGVLQSISDILGATDRGFTGSEIDRYLDECNIPNPFPTLTKRHRIFEALKAKQAADSCGNNIAAFIQHSMNPVRHHDAREWFEDTRSKLNHVLAFAGYELRGNGKLHQIEKVETHSQAIARAYTLREHLLIRKVHPDVLRYCREELLVDNYFHAVFEATKSVADKVRTLSGLTSDGAELVDEAFAFKSAIPYLALSTLRSESEQSEQKGFMNLLKGLFGTFRNTTAHAPKITWKIEEQDALDILSLVSLVHRRLDSATRARAIYEGKV
jgi:uncharacterized protein (TIGR02391 family)